MIILLGPSASGKTEVAKELVKEYGFHKVVTYTTRNMRINEINGIDYHFVSLTEFVEKINSGFFFEYVNYNGNFYGTARRDLDDYSVVILEPKGYQCYREKKAENIVSFYLESSEEQRRMHMLQRKDDLVKIEERILNDRKTFSPEAVADVDYVVNSSALSIDQMTEQINSIYKKRLEDN